MTFYSFIYCVPTPGKPALVLTHITPAVWLGSHHGTNLKVSDIPDLNPGPPALEADIFTARPVRRSPVDDKEIAG